MAFIVKNIYILLTLGALCREGYSVSCVCMSVRIRYIFCQYAQLQLSITKDAIVLSVRFAAIIKLRFSHNGLILKLERVLFTSERTAIFS